MGRFLEDWVDKGNRFYSVPHGTHAVLVPMEGVRGLAAFMVFVVHYCAQMTPWINQSSLTWQLIIDYRMLGATGVDLFFVLSGYLIYSMLLRSKKNFFSYFKRRIKRIYPTFSAVFILYLVLSLLFPQQSKTPRGYLMLLRLSLPISCCYPECSRSPG